MIGILLNETIELAYTLGKWTYYSGKWIYSWYYDISEPNELDTKIKHLQNEIDDLHNEINKLKS